LRDAALTERVALPRSRSRSVHGTRRSIASLAGILAAILFVFGASSTESVIANGDTRTISLHNIHTGESIVATFRKDGRYDPAVLRQLDHFCRDWRNNEQRIMDPRLFDTVWDAYQLSGSRQPIQVVSCYRSPATNAMLHRTTEGVARFSQHMLGKAMDQHYLDVPMSKIREIGMHLERGGVGYYPRSGIPFVHMDVGGVRYWPRMSYAQLLNMFPDGKAVFKAADGRTLPHYREALAEIRTRGHSDVMVAEAAPQKNILSALFGWARPKQPAPTAVAMAAASVRRREREISRRAPTQMASAERAELIPTAYEPNASVASYAPLPPARPSELTAQAFVARPPLPPERPVQVASLDPQAGMRLFARSAPGGRAAAPSIITRGIVARSRASAGDDVLAYAGPATTSGPVRRERRFARRSSFGIAEAVGLRAAAERPRSALVPARLDPSNFRAVTATRRLTHAPIRSTFGSTILPMRAAARLDVVSVAFAAQALCPTRFGKSVVGPTTGSFSGPAVQPIEQVASLN